MKLTIEGASEEINNVLLTILNSKEHTVSETFFKTISGHRDSPGPIGKAGCGSYEHIEIDGQKVAIASVDDPRPTMYFGDTEPKNPRKGDIWDSRYGIKRY